MIKFKDFLTTDKFHKEIDFPSVSASYNEHTLTLKFDSKDVILDAGYSGPQNPWLGSLCSLLIGKTLNDALVFNWVNWEEAFHDDQTFWDLRNETEGQFFNLSLELLKAALDIFRGREYLYQDTSPLICRCFGVRESDVLEHLKNHDSATLESLATDSKAGMGCRSCVPQLKRWLVLNDAKKFNHHYKERSIADWLVQIDYQLSRFPKASEWKMEVQGMKGGQVSISFEKEATQKEEELTAKELQDFLAGVVDTGLGFFLRRARHFSKAKG